MINNTNYLTDVGFGEFTFEPLELQLGVIQNDERGKQIPEYIFKNIERQFSEFEEMCNYHQTNPSSHFTTKRLISLPTKNGRITITGNKLKVKEFESIKESDIKNEIEFNEYLQNIFYK